MIPFRDLFQIAASTKPGFVLRAVHAANGWHFYDSVEATPLTASGETVFLTPSALCGDSPRLYHPLYPAACRWRTSGDLSDAAVPSIEFTTDEAVRRSMTLNAMRMTLEHFQTGSNRMLELIDNRLAAGQRDIAHDALVYLMRRLADVHAAERETENLCADSLAAWLGLRPLDTRTLLARSANAEELAAGLAAGEAGELKRTLDLTAVCANQWAQLEPERETARGEEDALFGLVKSIRDKLVRQD